MAAVVGTNSYITLTEADEYFDQRYGSTTWFDTADIDKEAALVSATQLLETLQFNGYAATTTQLLSWPRWGTYYDPKLGYQTNLDPTAIPDVVKTAQAEIAFNILLNPDVLESGPATTNLDVGGISLELIRKAPSIPPFVIQILKPYLVSAGYGATISYRR